MIQLYIKNVSRKDKIRIKSTLIFTIFSCEGIAGNKNNVIFSSACSDTWCKAFPFGTALKFT